MDGGLAPHRPRLLRLAAVQVGLVALYIAVPAGRHSWVGGVLVGVIAVVGGVLLATSRHRALPNSDTPLIDALAALATMLVLLVLGFSTMYFTLASRGGHLHGLHTKLDAVYFTVTTLSTVGYGDVVATSQVARGVVTLQIVFDLTFVAIAVRALVGRAQERG